MVAIELDALPVSDLIKAMMDDTATPPHRHTATPPHRHIVIAYNPLAEPNLELVASASAPAKLLVRVRHPLARDGSRCA